MNHNIWLKYKIRNLFKFQTKENKFTRTKAQKTTDLNSAKTNQKVREKCPRLFSNVKV